MAHSESGATYKDTTDPGPQHFGAMLFVQRFVARAPCALRLWKSAPETRVGKRGRLQRKAATELRSGAHHPGLTASFAAASSPSAATNASRSGHFWRSANCSSSSCWRSAGVLWWRGEQHWFQGAAAAWRGAAAAAPVPCSVGLDVFDGALDAAVPLSPGVSRTLEVGAGLVAREQGSFVSAHCSE